MFWFTHVATPTSRCPKSEVDVTKGDITFCEDNTFCQEGEVCCSNVCTKPLSEDQCLYENELHTIGETITKTNDVCRQCYCYGNGGRSATMVCTETNCTWGPNGNSFIYHVSKYLIICHSNIFENDVHGIKRTMYILNIRIYCEHRESKSSNDFFSFTHQHTTPWLSFESNLFQSISNDLLDLTRTMQFTIS